MHRHTSILAWHGVSSPCCSCRCCAACVMGHTDCYSSPRVWDGYQAPPLVSFWAASLPSFCWLHCSVARAVHTGLFTVAFVYSCPGVIALFQQPLPSEKGEAASIWHLSSFIYLSGGQVTVDLGSLGLGSPPPSQKYGQTPLLQEEEWICP